MKQQVKDINETLSSLVSEIQSLRKTVDSQYAEICQLNRNADKLLKENRELRKRLEKFEKPPKDSGNSNTPPSKKRNNQMPWLHLQLPWQSRDSIKQQRFRTWNPKAQGLTENLRLLPLPNRCRCLPCATFCRRHSMEERSISTWRTYSSRLKWRDNTSYLLLSLNSDDDKNVVTSIKFSPGHHV